MVTFVRVDRVLLRLLTALGALGLAAATTAATAVPAHAHSVLLGTSPSDEEQLAAAPDEVSLTFNEDITALGTQVVVTTEDGETVNDGEIHIDGPTITQALQEERPAGAYTVTWRAVSADGHPISGVFTFTAADPAGGAAAENATEGATQQTPGGAAEGTSSEAGAKNTPGDDAQDGTSQADSEATSGALSAGTWMIIAVLTLAAIILVTILTRSLGAFKRED